MYLWFGSPVELLILAISNPFSLFLPEIAGEPY